MNRLASSVLLFGMMASACAATPQDDYCIVLNSVLEQSKTAFVEFRGPIIAAERKEMDPRPGPPPTQYWTSKLTVPAFEECRVFKVGREAAGFQCHASSASELAGLGDAYTQIAERTKACLTSSGWDHFVPPRGGFVRADLFANPGTGMGVGVFVERQVTPWIDRSGSGDFHLYLRLQKMSP